MIVKIRIEGTSEECAEVVKELESIGNLRSVSRFYPNRGNTVEGRVYVNLEMAKR